jgi:cytochrome c-type biogenesis protein CcmH/NrfF
MKFTPSHLGRDLSFLGAVILLTIALALVKTLSAQTSSANFDDPNNAAVRSISGKLMCQCGGCGTSVLTCPHELDCASRGYILKTIRTSLAAGKTEQQIIAAMVSQYGPKILVEPPREGFSWLGWIMPFVALLVGGGAVAFVLWRWKSEPALDEPASPDEIGGTAGLGVPAAGPGNELVEKYRAQIDKELDREA